jgi:acyl-CoA hydrolase
MNDAHPAVTPKSGGTVSWAGRYCEDFTVGDVYRHPLTEYGIAELRGRSISQRATALIAIAHPDHRNRLRHKARTGGLLH